MGEPHSDLLFMWGLGLLTGLVIRDLLLAYLIPDDPDVEE